VNDPLRLRRISLGLVVVGALVAGLGSGIRAASDSGQANWTFLLDVVGLLTAITGGVFEARTADMLFDFAPGTARRRALFRLILGIQVTLIACVSLGSSSLDNPFLHGGASAMVVLGIGFGAGGLFSLLWYYGGRYAADHMQERSNDDW
jgi:hypothetical protein